MSSLFLSYARSDDEPFARRVCDDLSARGHKVWFDRTDMPNRGLSFTREIADAIETSERLLLVVGPHGLSSSYVEAEWRHALGRCKPVHPLLRLADYTALPSDLSKFDARDFRSDAKYEAEMQRLLRQLNDSPVQTGPLVGVPNLPLHFRPRPVDLDALRRIALADLHRPVALVGTRSRFGPHGAGGRGKTTLAAALARDCDVRTAFPDGVFWIELGPEPALVSLQAALARSLGDTGDAFTELGVGRARLSSLLANRACLLVLDNVWDDRHAWAFASDTLGPKCRALITTRDARVLEALGAESWPLDVLAEGDAVALLASWAKWEVERLPSEAWEVARACGGEPHSLVTVGGAARGIPDPWPELLVHLRNSDRSVIRRRLKGDPRWEMLRPIEISVQALPELERACYQDLAVFPRGAAVPETTILASWKMRGLEGFSARAAVRDLVDRSLLMRDADGRLTLHDHNHDYLQAMADDLPALHAKLLDTYLLRCPDGWPSGPEDGYFHLYLPFHLAQAGRAADLRALLLDYRWLQVKLGICGAVPLLDDNALLPGDAALNLVAGALRLSAHVIAGDACQLAGQLIGRLIGVEIMELQALCRQAERLAPRPCLLPRTASLTPAGGPLLRTLTGHGAWVRAVAVTPDGKWAVSASSDKTLKVWNLETGLELRTLRGHSDSVCSVAVTPDGKRAVSACCDKTLKVWDLETGREIQSLQGHGKRVNAVVVTPDGKRAISASHDETLKVWDLETGRELRTLQGHSDSVCSVAVTPDGKRVVSACCDKTLKVWDLETGRDLQTLEGHSDWVYGVTMMPDGKRALSTSGDSTLKVWDLETGRELATLEGHGRDVYAVAVAPDGRRAVSASDDKTLKLWDLETGRAIRTFEGHDISVSAVVITPDGKRAVSASDDATLKVWDLETGRELAAVEGHGAVVNAVAVVPDGKRVVSASDDYTLKVWDLDTGRELATMSSHTGWVRGVAVAPDGMRAVSASNDRTLKVWDLETGRKLATLKGHSDAVHGVAVTPDGKRVVSASRDKTLKVWDLETCQELQTLEGHDASVSAVVITSAGKRVVSASDDHTLRVWDLETGRELAMLAGHWSWLRAVVIAITPDGKCAVWVSHRELNVLELETGRELQTLEGHSDAVRGVAATPDGKRVVSVSDDKTLKLWDLESGTIMATYVAESRMNACAVAPDGTTIVAGDKFGRMHFLSYLE